MGKKAALLITLALVVATLAALIMLPTAVSPTAGPSAAAATSSPSVTRSAHIAYEACPAKDVVLSVTVNRHTFVMGQLVTYRVSLHNLSDRRCNVPGDQSPPTQPNGNDSSSGGGPVGYLLGPCSPLPVAIDNAKGLDVFPGPEAISCPAILGPPLAAHGTVSTTGNWSQLEGGLRPARVATQAPAGRYRIVVGGKVSVPITLVGVPPSPAVTSALRSTTNTSTNTNTNTNTTTTVALTGPTSTATAHIAFEGCQARDVTLRVTVPQWVAGSMRYDVTLDNTGNKPCGSKSLQLQHSEFFVGPCGSLSSTVVNALGVDVFPGAAVYSCPAFSGVRLPAHTTLSTQGSWTGDTDLPPQTGAVAQLQPAPPGTYHLVVGGKVDVPFTLTASPPPPVAP